VSFGFQVVARQSAADKQDNTQSLNVVTLRDSEEERMSQSVRELFLGRLCAEEEIPTLMVANATTKKEKRIIKNKQRNFRDFLVSNG
jgi:hypothetical protein